MRAMQPPSAKTLLGWLSGQQRSRQFANSDELENQIQQLWAAEKVVGRYLATSRGIGQLDGLTEVNQTHRASTLARDLHEEFRRHGVLLAGALDRRNDGVISGSASGASNQTELSVSVITEALTRVAARQRRAGLASAALSGATMVAWCGLCRSTLKLLRARRHARQAADRRERP